MAKKNDWIAILVVGGVLLLALGVIKLPTGSVQPQGTAPPASGGLLTSNPSLNFTVVDTKTNSVVNEATVELYDSTGVFVTTGTTSSGAVALSNLSSNITYTYVVKPASGTTAFYAFTGTVATNAAGSKPVPVGYLSESTTAPTLTVYNNDGLTANSYTVPQAIGANDDVSFRIRVRPASSANDNNYFGDGTSTMVVAVDYNTVAFNQILVREGTTNLSAATLIPVSHQAHDGNQTSSLYFQSVSTKLSPSRDYDFYVEAKSGSQNPVAASGELYVTFYDSCLVKNTLTGKYGEYPRDPVSGSTQCSADAAASAYFS